VNTGQPEGTPPPFTGTPSTFVPNTPGQEITAPEYQTGGVGGAQQFFDQAVKGHYEQAASRLDPRFREEQEGLEAQLQNMGLTRGSTAWNAEMDRLSRNKNDAYSSAMNYALQSGGADAARMQGMDIAKGEFGNKWTGQGFQDKMSSQDQAFRQREQVAQRQQQAAQWGLGYEQADRAQKAQMDQFAQTLGMTGKQLDAQIAQWAAQNGITKEQMAQQLIMSREQNQTAKDVAGIGASATAAAAASSAGASKYAADLGAASSQASADLARQKWEAEMKRQAQFDPYLLQNLQMGVPSPNLGGGALGG
jgi:hypothetical protein